MKKFSSKDIEDYYDQTEVHYRMFWKLEKVMGLHYGIWTDKTKNITEAILNTNILLKEMGEIKASDKVLDAGCGIGGSSIFLAKSVGCSVTGISLSKKQVETATKLAAANASSPTGPCRTRKPNRRKFKLNERRHKPSQSKSLNRSRPPSHRKRFP